MSPSNTNSNKKKRKATQELTSVHAWFLAEVMKKAATAADGVKPPLKSSPTKSRAVKAKTPPSAKARVKKKKETVEEDTDIEMDPVEEEHVKPRASKRRRMSTDSKSDLKRAREFAALLEAKNAAPQVKSPPKKTRQQQRLGCRALPPREAIQSNNNNKAPFGLPVPRHQYKPVMRWDELVEPPLPRRVALPDSDELRRYGARLRSRERQQHPFLEEQQVDVLLLPQGRIKAFDDAVERQDELLQEDDNDDEDYIPSKQDDDDDLDEDVDEVPKTSGFKNVLLGFKNVLLGFKNVLLAFLNTVALGAVIAIAVLVADGTWSLLTMSMPVFMAEPSCFTGSSGQVLTFLPPNRTVAHLGKPDFNVFITYTADDDGDPKSGTGPSAVEVFAPGMRNPYGNLYGTDNGPTSTGCGPGQQIPDKYASDELNLIKKNNWYGHPNHKRAQDDPKQCVWYGPGYTMPLMVLQSSTGAIIEFASDHFNMQIRGNLIYAKYGLEIYLTVFDQTGNPAPGITAPISIGGDMTLGLTKAPSGDRCLFPVERMSLLRAPGIIFKRTGHQVCLSQ